MLSTLLSAIFAQIGPVLIGVGASYVQSFLKRIVPEIKEIPVFWSRALLAFLALVGVAINYAITGQAPDPGEIEEPLGALWLVLTDFILAFVGGTARFAMAKKPATLLGHTLSLEA